MPELPEVEIMVRRLDAALAGSTVESAAARAMATLKSFDPPLSALSGKQIQGVHRRSKLILISFEGAITMIVHLMSAGRLQLYDTRASLKDKTVRLVVRLTDGRELRLREFGTRQSTWAKVVRDADLAAEYAVEKLGPEAWPDPPGPEELARLLSEARPLHSMLRDQKVLAGIGRSWVDEILHTAALSPFKRGNTLSPPEVIALREAIVDRLGGAIAHYEEVVRLPIPDKLPMPLTVHGREGSECPRCGTILEAVFFEDYVVAYCPACQTGGKALKDRRLSKLIK